MTISQTVFLGVSFAAALLCLRGVVVSLRHAQRYRGAFQRRMRVYWGAAVSAMLTVVILASGYEAVFGDGLISVIDWGRAVVNLAIASLFISTLRAFERRDHLEIRLAAASQTDPLTQLPNRAGFDALAAPLLEECAAKGLPASVAMLDIDRFKAVNDGWGHQAGDEVLRALAHTARVVTRTEDVLARYGGEEFILLLGGVRSDAALPMVERLRQAISADVVHPSGKGRITVSAGIAQVTGSRIKSLEQAIRDADAALYMAKNAGRDSSVIFPGDQRGELEGQSNGRSAAVV